MITSSTIFNPLSPRRLPSHHRRRYSPLSSTTTSKLPNEMLSDSSVLRNTFTVFVFIAAALFSCCIIYRADYYRRSYALDIHQDSEEFSLERVLKNATMRDKTVILTTLNEAWAAPNSIIDLFLESFRVGDRTRGLLNNLVIIALDDKAFQRCLVLHTHCFPLVTEGVDFSGEAYFMTNDYLKMMWRRIDFLRSVLELGYNFVFTDADIMWFRNPFPRFYRDADFQIACDYFIGNSSDLQNSPNGGFNYVKSNNRSIEFYKFWYLAREIYPGHHDQDVLNIIKFDPFIANIGLRMRFLDTAFFGGLCEPSRDLNRVCTMHANCCFGLHNKIHDLGIILQDWRQFKSWSPILKKSVKAAWRAPQNCSTVAVQRDPDPGINVQQPLHN